MFLNSSAWYDIKSEEKVFTKVDTLTRCRKVRRENKPNCGGGGEKGGVPLRGWCSILDSGIVESWLLS